MEEEVVDGPDECRGDSWEESKVKEGALRLAIRILCLAGHQDCSSEESTRFVLPLWIL